LTTPDHSSPSHSRDVSPRERVRTELDALRETDRHRRLRGRAEAEVLDFSSNDYLNFSRDPRVVAGAQSALEQFGAGSTASRLVSGSLACHTRFEMELAAWKDCDAALLFGSGYLTALGCVRSFVGQGDVVLADRLSHACLLDAGRGSGARVDRFRHNDLEHLDARLAKHHGKRVLVVTESVFSMDGDLAPIEEIAELVAANPHAMLLVDEAHAAGVFGPGLAHQVDGVDLQMGTLSKSFGSYGGYVGLSADHKDWLVNTSRSLIYTTAPPPASIGAALAGLKILRDEPELGDRLLERAGEFCRKLWEAGFDTLDSDSQIVPLVIGEDGDCLAAAAELKAEGIHVVAIRPPTVPEGTARLRFSITLAHSAEELDRTADTVIRLLQDRYAK